MKQFSVILIGAGDRGTTYVKHMKSMPEKFKIVAVAEPIEARRNFVKDLFDLGDHCAGGVAGGWLCLRNHAGLDAN